MSPRLSTLRLVHASAHMERNRVGDHHQTEVRFVENLKSDERVKYVSETFLCRNDAEARQRQDNAIS